MSATPSSGGGTFGAATSAHRLSTRVISVSRHAPVVSSAARHVATQQHDAGPGQRRAPGANHGQSVIERGGLLEATVQGGSVSEGTVSLAVAVTDLPSESPETLVTSHALTQVSNQSSQGPHILPEEEAYLELVEALLLITAKLLGFKFASTHFDLDGRIDLILSNTTLQEDTAGDFPSLDLFRKFCLLVFYEFHQFPGQQAWMRIGKIVRLAYWMGLDRLDIIQSVSPEWSNVSYKDLQNWKLVWWCVYRLDSYANLSSGTPYQIDERLVNTSFTHDHYQGLVSPCKLPHDPRGLPDLLLFVKTGSESSLLFNIHLITITVLRQFGRAMSMRYLVPHENLTAILLDAERTLSAIRLALPRNFLNPGRNAFMNESNTNHHARLVSVLHLHMAQLLAALSSCYYLPEGDDWTLSWQRVLEICQNIAGIAEKWDSNYTLTVDPALSLISLTALVFLDIHKKYTDTANVHLISEIENCELLLLLQLEQFSAHWKLPSLLILSFKSFKELVTGPLSYPHIQLILSRFESPLHPRWLQFLSSAQTHLENVIWGHGT
ncbi:hypothetical protein DER46DRAFT_627795 [Fusarium sp. MPI-SDFR-AT-0072]|nr:hypothetical protein DER46DRAFT_627795 [Fusarium sp. MPI-SDFR-AT-0072]